MQRCRCGRDQRFGEAWCPVCGARFGAGVAGLGPGAVPPPRRAGTVLAAQVVLALGAAGNALIALFGVVALFAMLSIVAYTGLEAVLPVLAGLLYCLAAIGFDVWAALAVGRGNRTARMLATVVPAAAIVVDVVVFALLGSDTTQAAVIIVLSVPHAAALAILLWVPEASRRHFGDAVPAAPRPVPSGPTPTPASALSFTQNPMPVPAPRPATDDRDAVTVTLPAATRPASAPTPTPSARSLAPTLVPSSARSVGPATPPGGRHRVGP